MKTTTLFFVLLLCVFPALAGDQTSVGGPVSGFVFDQKQHTLRPMLGVPGSAYLGDALLANLDAAAVAPDGQSALVVQEGDLFRICLQDHRILVAARELKLGLRSLLTYVLTHELVHVVRFGQRLQIVDLAQDLRSNEERMVERTTRTILAKTDDLEISRFLAGPYCAT